MNIRTSYDQSEFDYDLIVPAIQNSYWGEGRIYSDITCAFENSYNVGYFLQSGGQIAWARATSDTIYHAYIFDLYVLREYRGNGYGKQLVTDLMAHPELTRVSGWMLSTRQHHDLYRQFGFMDAEPKRYMSLKKNE